MYKLLIVEDNEFERNALENYIDWDALGIKVLEAAANGKEGLEAVKEYKPDIIISDVKMPLMDGVEMANLIRGIHPKSKFIFCSGYDDVKLFKDALEIRAYNYLIKPVNHDELISTVKKIVSELIDERIAFTEHAKITEQYNLNLHLIQEEFLKSLIFCKHNRQEGNALYLKANNLKLRMTGEFQIALIDMKFEDRINGFDAFGKSMEVIQQITKSGITKNIRLIQTENHEIIVIFHAIKDNNNDSDIKALIKTINKLSKSNNFVYIAGISESAPNLTDLHTIFKQCNFLIKKKTEVGYGNVLFYKDFEDLNLASNQILNTENIKHIIDDIINLVCEGQSPENDLDKLVLMISKKSLKLEMLHSIFIDLISRLSANISQIGYSLEQIFDEKIDFYTIILSRKTLPDISTAVKEILETVSIYFARKKENKEEYIVKEILDIIHKEFDQAITLSYLSERVYLSSNYLRIIFKEKMDISIQNYLTNLRINKAKELLRKCNLKINQIGNKIGYTNSTYFNVVFKGSVGITPGEYRSKYANNN